VYWWPTGGARRGRIHPFIGESQKKTEERGEDVTRQPEGPIRPTRPVKSKLRETQEDKGRNKAPRHSKIELGEGDREKEDESCVQKREEEKKKEGC